MAKQDCSNKYQEALAALAEPESFDARVFQGDENCPQHVCDLVLSLAVVFNDLKDIVLGQQLLMDVIPDTREPTKELGQAGGISEHLFRILMALIHELLVLLDNSRPAIKHAFFQQVVKKLHPEARSAWSQLVALKKGAKSNQPLARLVYFARNKVAFHYDVKAIASGYNSVFAGDTRIHRMSRPGRVWPRRGFTLLTLRCKSIRAQWQIQRLSKTFSPPS